MKKKEIYKFLSDGFGAPCDFKFNDIDVDDFMFCTDEDWCKEHCDNKENYAKCWKRFLNNYKEEMTLRNDSKEK